ncbi:hemerythrin [Mycobacterium sp. SWH-M3]|nr:hemerythrin [Mycobacterium sp. SWH-M3]
MTKAANPHPDLVDDIIADHREVEEVFKELEKNEDPPRRRDLVEHVVTELVRHSVAEEQYLYPTARRVLDDGDELADHELKEHAQAELVMKQIEKTDTDDPRFEELVGKLIGDIRHHIEDEEQDLLPKLRAACAETDLRKLGEKFEKAKKAAPTRPHPAAPDRPPVDMIIGPGVRLIDRLRDALTGRGG